MKFSFLQSFSIPQWYKKVHKTTLSIAKTSLTKSMMTLALDTFKVSPHSKLRYCYGKEEKVLNFNVVLLLFGEPFIPFPRLLNIQCTLGNTLEISSFDIVTYCSRRAPVEFFLSVVH